LTVLLVHGIAPDRSLAPRAAGKKVSGDAQRSPYCETISKSRARGQGAGDAGTCRGPLRRAAGKRDSLLVTETGVARRPLAHLELRHVPRYEVLDGLPDVRSAEDDRAHVREVEEPVQNDNR
jgi:hypothetical protein